MNVLDLQFTDRAGHAVQLWAVLHHGHLFELSYSIAPRWDVETITFDAKRAA